MHARARRRGLSGLRIRPSGWVGRSANTIRQGLAPEKEPVHSTGDVVALVGYASWQSNSEPLVELEAMEIDARLALCVETFGCADRGAITKEAQDERKQVNAPRKRSVGDKENAHNNRA